jgi:hypothetical protein
MTDISYSIPRYSSYDVISCLGIYVPLSTVGVDTPDRLLRVDIRGVGTRRRIWYILYMFSANCWCQKLVRWILDFLWFDIWSICSQLSGKWITTCSHWKPNYHHYVQLKRERVMSSSQSTRQWSWSKEKLNTIYWLYYLIYISILYLYH